MGNLRPALAADYTLVLPPGWLRLDAAERLDQLVRAHFDLTPYGIREMLNLHRPIYRGTASYGHFGREEPNFTWERTDKAAALRAAAGL